jgi:anaphase-promoting complex subunit 2
MTVKTSAPTVGRKRVFDSVFPSSRLKDLAPTPSATPVLGQTEFGQSFGGPLSSPFSQSSIEASEGYPEQIVWDRAWHSATSFLTLPGRDFVGQTLQRDLDAFTAHYNKPPKDVTESIRYVASKQYADRAQEQNRKHESIVEWYTDHVRGHFLAYSKPSLLRVSTR